MAFQELVGQVCQIVFDLFKGFLALFIPHCWDLHLEQSEDWFTRHSELGYEPIDVIYPPQKSLDLLFSSWRLHLYNFLDFLKINFYSPLAYHKP